MTKHEEGLEGWVADRHGGYEDFDQAIRSGRTCVSLGGGQVMLMRNLEDAARAIQPDEDPDPILSTPDNLGLVENHPNRWVQRVIEQLRRHTTEPPSPS